MIDPPAKPIDGLVGETRLQWIGAGGARMVSYVALWMNCRVEWSQPGEGS